MHAVNTTIEDLNPTAGKNTIHIEGEEVLLTQERLQVGVNMQDAQTAFENRFGVDQKTRTTKQWKNLVEQYGMDTVIKMEKMSKRAVKDKCRN